MQENLIYILPILALLLGIVLAYLVTKIKFEKITTTLEERNHLLTKQKVETDKFIAQIQAEKEHFRNEKETVNLKLATKIAELQNLEIKLAENKAEVEKLQERFTKDFEILASKILEEKSEKFTAKNKENIELILNPLQEKIKSFEKKVEDTHKESLEKQSALREQINGLRDLNQKMSKDAINLTKALKGESKKQGDWGELQLEIILEKAGLQKNIHFSTQGGYRDEHDNLKKPDFIIHLPENKHLIIDSKVSLTGYDKFYNAEIDTEESLGLKQHLLSIKKHIKDLGGKNYSELYGINSPDYVLMFVPIEPALMVALQNDQNLYLEALDKNVVLVSNSTLLATLTTVASIWKQEDQKRNVLEIARQAGALYDKFKGFIDDLIRVGNQINASQDSYKAAMNKLHDGKGNLISRVENLKNLGAKAQKSIPENLLKSAQEE